MIPASRRAAQGRLLRCLHMWATRAEACRNWMLSHPQGACELQMIARNDRYKARAAECCDSVYTKHSQWFQSTYKVRTRLDDLCWQAPKPQSGTRTSWWNKEFFGENPFLQNNKKMPPHQKLECIGCTHSGGSVGSIWSSMGLIIYFEIITSKKSSKSALSPTVDQKIKDF